MTIAIIAATTITFAACAGPTSKQVDYVVFDASKIDAILGQCSRGTPPKGEGSWTPAAGDVEKLEDALPAALAKQPSWRSREFNGAPNDWFRQYVGIVRGGHRFIYGNFVPKFVEKGDAWRRDPIVVCDGGPTFFGVDYDAENGVIVGMDFNGVA